MEVESSSALQTIVNSTVNARTLESIINNPLTFEKASYSTVSSMNARYTPLNRPFTLNHETSNGVSHGEDIPVSSHKATEDMNGVNGNVKKEKDEDAQSVISTEWPRTFLRPPGLKNMANTCYMNSTLQALMHVPPLVRYFLNRTHSDRCIYLSLDLSNDRFLWCAAVCFLSNRETCPRFLSVYSRQSPWLSRSNWNSRKRRR